MTESPGPLNRLTVRGRLLIEGRLVEGTIEIAGDTIAEVRLGSTGCSSTADLEAAIVSPGLVDLQVNGAFGLDVGEGPQALRGLAARLPTTGVTAFLPAIVSTTPDRYRAVAAAFESSRDAPGARMLGLHLEGPLLAASKIGAHPREAVLAGDATFDDAVLPELIGRGYVRLVTLAPERPGALARIARLVESGVTVSLGHTDATFDQMIAGAGAGATLCTHLYSAMSPFHHRAPGAVGAALTDDRLTVTLIADGVHADPAALNLALRAKRSDGIVLVTDAVAAAGSPPGRYQLGGTPIVSDGACARLESGTLAGSTLTMDRAVRTMVSLGGARLEDALAMASTVPAARIGATGTGRIAAGQRADLALWTASMEIAATLVGGRIVFRAP